MPLYSHYPHAEIAAGRHDVPPSAPDAERFVREADIGDGWLHPYASNYTFVVRLSLDEQEGCGVYKPQTGERPLWDFPTGTLAHRECATYELARALGWGLVPPTVLREGEADEGSLQLFVPHDPDSNFFTLRDEHPEEAFRLAVLDLLANNADRKGGHCFVGPDGRVWAIDNGLTFHEEWKLRTVIWDYSDERYPTRWSPTSHASPLTSTQAALVPRRSPRCWTARRWKPSASGCGASWRSRLCRRPAIAVTCPGRGCRRRRGLDAATGQPCCLRRGAISWQQRQATRQEQDPQDRATSDAPPSARYASPPARSASPSRRSALQH